MPLSGNEKHALYTRLTAVIDEFGHTGPAEQGAPLGHVGLAPDAFIIVAERLLIAMGELSAQFAEFLHRATGEAGEPEKPKGKGGRPRKDQQAQPPQGNGPTDPFGDPNAKPQDDPLGVPEPSPQQQPMTDVQVKDALRTYMQAWGTEGTARLTDLLTRIAGVKRFSDLPANKWGAVVQAAQQEMTQAK